MANEQFITIRGRLTNDPEMRFTGSGTAVASFTIAANARTFDKQTNEWKDKETIFWRCSAWRELAENAVESLTKGTAVVAIAELEARSFESNGEKRTVTEAKIEAIGPDLRWASAKVTRTQRNNNQGGGYNGGQQTQQGPAQDPWGAPGQQPAWNNPSHPDHNAPPF